MDKVDKQTRSQIMSKIKARGNRSTEKRLRALLVAHGLRGWTLHKKAILGTPDFTFLKERVLIFVDGCFWHGCPHCYRRPKSYQDYWDKKVYRNIARDQRTRAKLRRAGWSVIQIWEHSLKEPIKPIKRIKARLQKRKLGKTG